MLAVVLSVLRSGTLAILAATILSALMLAGCGGPSSIQVRGVEPLNRNSDGSSTPVRLRFYQLRDEATFDHADFDKLWADGSGVLGQTLIGKPVVVTILPGTRQDRPITVDLGILDGAARVIGVMGLYHQSDAGDHRRLVISVNDLGRYLVECTGYSLSLVADSPSATRPATADSSGPALDRRR